MSKILGRVPCCGFTRIPLHSRIEVTEGKYKGKCGIARQPSALIHTPLPKGYIGILFDEGGIAGLPEQMNVRVTEIQIIK